jgi:Arc/MetJ-type ribon-helix-helix transcriptional regulator
VETEKVCVNLPAAELGKIDVLIAEGMFASRTDLIRTGIKAVLDEHQDTVKRVVSSARVGYQLITAAELEGARRTKVRLNLFVVGVLRIVNSVTPELADATIERIRIFGSIRANPAVLDVLAERIVRGADNLGEI